MVELLLSNGSDINISGSVRDRPIHLASSKANLKIMQLLVEGTSQQKADGRVRVRIRAGTAISNKSVLLCPVVHTYGHDTAQY